jgi:porin
MALFNPRLFLLTLVALFSALTMSRAVGTLNGDAEAFPIVQRNTVTGEWAGARSKCCDRGVELFAGYTAEVWGNTSGGIKTGSLYTGLLDFGVNLDFEKLSGWNGMTMGTSWKWLSGRDASQDLVGNFLTSSNIAGFNTLCMTDLWAQQELMDGQLSIRAGQITADSEFLISDYGSLFINGAFGWPPFASMNLPNGGPAFPMGTPGTRIAWNPVDWFTFLTAGFQGNVFEPNINRHGFRWRLDEETGFTFMNEAQFRWGQAEESKILPGTIKIGAWFQTGECADALAETTSSGNSGYYLVLDQMLFRESSDGTLFPSICCKPTDCTTFTSDTEKKDQGIGCFARVGCTPPDRNAVDFYFDTGLTYKGLIPKRDNDTIGLAFCCAKTNSKWQRPSPDVDFPANGSEMVLEATYQVELAPWMTLQPDIQYIINPGGQSSIDNALVIGCRASVLF